MFDRFVHWEAASGVVLLASTALALAWTNSPWSALHYQLAGTKIALSWGDAG
jgi:Na+/H+ antiporter NhaA